MSLVKLIADSGATKTEWSLLNSRRKTILTQGMSPYFLSSVQMTEIMKNELIPRVKNVHIDAIYFYGTGCHTVQNARVVKDALRILFPDSMISVEHDLSGAARALCGNEKGIACILGTGSNSCYYNGKKIIKNSPGLGFILGDEGSGAYLGKKVLQYYLYNTYDEELQTSFDALFGTTSSEILNAVYKEPLPNRYLASFAKFLSENRGHYMIENILDDGLNDFFFMHVCKYRECWTLPIHFVGGIAYAFRDKITQLCESYKLELGKILTTPMEGLIKYHL